MPTPDQAPAFQDDTIVPQTQAEVDNLQFSGLGETINPDSSMVLDNVAQQAYESARRLVDNNALRHNLEHDDLTGLLTKSALLSNANKRLAEATTDQQFAVLFIDLDNFKAVNDKHPGKHDEGDAVLRDTARLLTQDTRHNEQFLDLLAHGKREDSDPARLGGDEFAVFVELTARDERSAHLTPAERALAIRSRLQDDFNDYLSKRPDLQELGFGMSVGIALHEQGQSAEDMLIQADQALKAEKDLHHSQNGSYRS